MITLNPLFCDGAVFQQKMQIPVWGNAAPAKLLKAEFAGTVSFTKASAAGAFMFRLPAIDAGGPYTLVITDTDSGESVKIDDILVGEVWIASGQSNMEYQLCSDYSSSFAILGDDPPSGVNRKQEKEYCDTIKDPSIIRYFNVTKKASGLEEDTVEGKWEHMSPEKAPASSAVAAWYARFLQEKLNVPVGIINSSWGGTVAEAWTSRAGLLSNPETAGCVSENDQIMREEETITKSVLPATVPPADAYLDPGNKGFDLGWAKPEFDDSTWNEIVIPGSWIRQKVSGNGALWVRTTVDIPGNWIGKDLVLEMGGIDKQDTTYFNGTKIGGMGEGNDAAFWNTPRSYKVPANIVKAGKNTIAVRAYSFIFDGAFLGLKANYFIHPEGDTERIDFAGTWKACAELNLGVLCPAAVSFGPGNPNTPGILFNSMIRPLIPYGIRGAIWYQGESNAKSKSDSLVYEGKLGTMIRDWRYLWAQGEFPFIQVQLANYSPDHNPAYCDHAWPVLRDVQRRLCNQMNNVFMASAIDIGELDDIHPQDKKTVGKRLADCSAYNVYRVAGTVPSGPLYRSISIEGDAIRITFDHADGLTVREDLPQSFYIAGKLRGFCPATEVKVEDNTILVRCAKISAPYAVRYGWSDAAISTVYNEAGLPASPFRTDDWEFCE